MADTLKVLAQVAPTSGVLTDLYTVPGATSTMVSSVLVSNRGTTPLTFRLSIAVAGAADDTKQYLYWDVVVPARDTFAATIGISLAATDVLRGMISGLGSFNVLGVEVT